VAALTPRTRDPGLHLPVKRRVGWPLGTVVFGFITVNVCKLDCSRKKNMKALFAPVFRMWIDGREDEVEVISVSKTVTPMYGLYALSHG
jgi:hypothetical protein